MQVLATGVAKDVIKTDQQNYQDTEPRLLDLKYKHWDAL
jgi:hypothetical protein